MRSKSSDKSKPKCKKGLWSPEEDERLRDYILSRGIGCWSSVPINAGLERNGKSCRLRWINYLRPGLKRGMFSVHEDEMILTLHRCLGNKWSQIAQNLSGRTDNEIKNYWHSYLKKKSIDYKETETNSSTWSSDNSESSSPTKTRSFESMETMKQSTTTYHTTPLPKILFAEWLSLDNHNHHDHIPESFNYESVAFKDVFDQNPSYPNDVMVDTTNLLSHETFCDEFYGGEMFPEFKLEEQNQNQGNVDVDFVISGENNCTNYNMNSDEIYIL